VQASCLRSPFLMQTQRSTTSHALERRLHPRLAKWFRGTYPSFTQAQLLCVPAILDRQSILLTSPTGSGKTLAGFLGVFDALLRKIDEQGQTRTSLRLRSGQAPRYREMYAKVESVTSSLAS
jgi:superfamily II DNA/RNA helicase